MSGEKEEKEVKEELSPVDSVPVVAGDKGIEEVTENMPEVVPDAVAAAEEKDRQAQKTENIVDPKGRVFDPAIHATGPDGKPLLTPTGRFKKKFVGPTHGIQTPPPDVPVDQSYKVVAKTVVGIFIQSGYALVGDEWLPEKSKEMDEEANLVAVTEVYCQSIGLRDLPPGLVCAVAFCAYGLRRFNKPKTKSFVEKMTGGIKNFFVGLWFKFKGVKNARPNNRSDSDGKNDTGVSGGEKV